MRVDGPFTVLTCYDRIPKSNCIVRMVTDDTQQIVLGDGSPLTDKLDELLDVH